MTKHVMLDLETMSSESNAAIVSIGAVVFDELTIGDTFQANIFLESEQRAGAHISADTIMWWMRQAEAARDAISSLRATSATDVLARFAIWLNPGYTKSDVAIWGNGAGFDNVVLSNAYARHNISRPWSYRGDRCFRTIRQTFPDVVAPQFEGEKHRALDDAINQAKWLQDICAKHSFQLG